MKMSYEHFTTWRERESTGQLALTVVIPTFDDATEIVATTAAIASHLASSAIDFEIIITDGGSADSTVERATRLGLRNVHILSPERPRGKGASARQAVFAARGRHILLTDASLSTPIEHVDRLLAVAQAGGDVVVGGRSSEGNADAAGGAMRRLCCGMLRRRVGADIADPKRGFTLFTRDAAQKLFARRCVSGVGYDLEVLWRADNRRMKIVEVPGNWFEAPPALGDDPFALPRKAVLTLPERFDRHASSELDTFTPLRGERVCIDGSLVRLADTVAIQSLVDARLRFLDAGADLYITTPSNSLRITLELTGDDALLKPAQGMDGNDDVIRPQRNGRRPSMRIESRRHEQW